jgi:hypothetical protein
MDGFTRLQVQAMGESASQEYGPGGTIQAVGLIGPFVEAGLPIFPSAMPAGIVIE